LELYYNNEWVAIPFTLTGHAAHGVDVSVIAPPFSLSPPLELQASNEGITYGQDVFFLGFPYGLSGDIGGLNRNYPLPLVKKAILSAFSSINDSEVLLLDGHNNPGFSGGPVVFKKPGTKDFKVASIISSYHYQQYPIFSEENKTDLTYQYNTGIIISYSIQRAIELIEHNQNGAKIDA